MSIIRRLNKFVSKPIGGLILICVVLIIMTIVVALFSKNETRYVSNISLLISIFGLMIGMIAYYISRGTSNAQFLSVVSKFEDRRIDMRFNEKYLHIGMWKALVDIDEAMELANTRSINPDYLNKLANRFKTLMTNVVIPKTNQLYCEEIKHILKMYKYILDLDIPQSLKSESESLIRQFFDFNDDLEITKEYADLIIGNVIEAIRWELYIEHRANII